MTLGDVLAALALILIVGASWAATLLLCALAFPARVAAAQAKLTDAPGVCLGRGFLVLVVGGLAIIALSHAAAGPVRLLAALVGAGLGAVASLGSAACVRLLSERIDALGSPMTPFAGLTRASLLYVAAGFLPVIGWGIVLPAALLLSLGSGSAALLRRPRRVRPASSISAAPMEALP